MSWRPATLRVGVDRRRVASPDRPRLLALVPLDPRDRDDRRLRPARSRRPRWSPSPRPPPPARPAPRPADRRKPRACKAGGAGSTSAVTSAITAAPAGYGFGLGPVSIFSSSAEQSNPGSAKPPPRRGDLPAAGGEKRRVGELTGASDHRIVDAINHDEAITPCLSVSLASGGLGTVWTRTATDAHRIRSARPCTGFVRRSWRCRLCPGRPVRGVGGPEPGPCSCWGL